MEVLGTMKEEVHACDGGRGEVLLLTEEAAKHEPVVCTGFTDVVERLEEHAASATRRVVDGLACLGIEHLHHESHHGTRRIELASLLVREVCELPYQILVSITEQIVRNSSVGQVHPREVVDEIDQKLVGQALLVGPLDVAEDAIEGVRVGLLDLPHRAGDGGPDVG